MMQFAFVFVFIFSMLPQGYGLKCYSCQPQTGQNPDGCKAPSEMTCPMCYDRCLTMNATMQMDIGGGNIMTINTEMRNCSVSMMCNEATKQKTCQSMNTTGTLKKCEYSCCQGNLCNDGVGPLPTFAPKPPAKILSCYECSPEGMGPNGTGEALISCDNPRERQCGEVAPGVRYDRCMTIKMAVKNPQTGAIQKQEMRNCSISCSMCQNNMACQNANSTGGVVSCETTCCTDDLCNTDQPKLTTTPAGPKAGQTALAISNIAIIGAVIALLFKWF